MTLVDDFTARYIKEFDFYEQVARAAADMLEADLQAAGVRCIVTSRAKSVSRLREKCEKRLPVKGYSTLDDLYEDIVDLAGIRVALYFPGEREIVDGRVKHLFEVLEPSKNFPEAGHQRPGKPRFEGYAASHYRVRLREKGGSEQDNRYAAARLEIQVASVLMHAWSEVEHDLVYKPADGDLSHDELALLDQLNGLVVAGEIALEALQAAARRKVENGVRSFKNHYELAAYLLSRVDASEVSSISDGGIGRIDQLFLLIRTLGIDTPDKLHGYLDALHGDVERRPLADQVIDAILREKDSGYIDFRRIRRKQSVSHGDASYENEAVGKFLRSWIAYEKLERDLIREREPNLRRLRTVGALHRLGLLDEERQQDVEVCRRLRNAVVHGIEPVPPQPMVEASARIGQIVKALVPLTAERRARDHDG